MPGHWAFFQQCPPLVVAGGWCFYSFVAYSWHGCLGVASPTWTVCRVRGFGIFGQVLVTSLCFWWTLVIFGSD